MSEWKEVMLQDVVSILGDGLHGTPKFDDRGEYYFINGNNLINGKITIKDSTRRTSKTEYDKYKKDLNDRTILVSINGTLGNLAFFNDEKCILGKSVCYFNVLNNTDKKFIGYVVSGKSFQNYIDSLAHGTTIKNVSLRTMREFSFLLPTFSEQKAIASILSSIDDKIDLLHRQNATLEAIAETLFRQWFVEESVENWKIITLGELTVISSGKSRPKEEGTIPVYGGNGIFGYANISNCKGSSIIIGRVGAYCGSVFYENKEVWVSDNALLVQAKKPNTIHFLFYLLKTLDLNSMAEGSSHPLLTQTLLKGIEVRMPPINKIEMFDLMIEQITYKIEANKNQVFVLTSLRDNLLPKLMSGEVGVKID